MGHPILQLTKNMHGSHVACDEIINFLCENYLFHCGPGLQQGQFISFYLHAELIFNGKQNVRLEKGNCCYLVKFYGTIDTVYAEFKGYGLFYVSLLCALVFFSAATL